MSTLTVASLNLCNFCAPPFSFYDFESSYTKRQWHAKEAWLCHLVTQSQPDIICFQEVFSVAMLKQLLQPLGLTHFAYAELPQQDENNRYLYKSPVVMFASRFALHSIEAVKPQAFLHMADCSRQIVRCYATHPHFGEIRLYGCHFKSKRPMDLSLDREFSNLAASTDYPLATTHIANLVSNKQRHDEALAFYTDFIFQQVHTLLPTFIMGDFNQQTINSSLDFLSEETETKQSLDADLKLLDSFYLTQLQVRPATHFYQGKGSVLDYILCPESILSQLNLKQLTFDVYDDYLNQDEINQSSDHALIVLKLK